MSFKRLAPAVDKLIETLEQKADAFETLESLFEQQLDALRHREADALGPLAAKAQDCTDTIDDLRQTYRRQARLLIRLLELEQDDPSLDALIAGLKAQAPSSGVGPRLDQARAAVVERAESAQAANDTLQFALQYAAGLNHELLAAVQEAAADTDSRTYTADGTTQSGGGEHSLVNTIG
ncbi:flagellar protein FlgN [Salinibacter altiplanensis]|uniref:flagellar protein FlgN n=1 Tax=Salinibacter altiplanensis TaxID=1803181 RepID=UPI000C9FD642|nr:flagellar protein FlgN [Salinibacter altiplanensis]